MTARSAGILMYRRDRGRLRVLLVHPGGPFWAKRDSGAWSIPKGEHDPDESPWLAALREFEEETGLRPTGSPLALGEVVQKSGKKVTAFALEGELDVARLRSNLFNLEWPPKSGRIQSFPEIDRAEWFSIAAAKEKIIPAQRPLLDRLVERIGEDTRSTGR